MEVPARRSGRPIRAREVAAGIQVRKKLDRSDSSRIPLTQPRLVEARASPSRAATGKPHSAVSCRINSSRKRSFIYIAVMREWIRLATVMLMAIAAPTVMAQTQAPRDQPWTTQWIAAPGVPQKDEVVLHFRKTIRLPQKPEHFFVDVSADNKFIFYINQQRVGGGPSHSDLAHWRYETYDLAPLLHTGENILAATVWNFGTHAAVRQMSDRVGFLVHGESPAERIADTDLTWEVAQEKGIETIQPQVNGYYAAGPGELLDGAKFDWGWNSDSRKESWVKAISLGRAAPLGTTDAPNNWQLVADPLPPMQFAETEAGRVVRATGIDLPTGNSLSNFTVPAHAKVSILLDDSQLTTAYPALAVSGGEGATIRLTYSEALVDDHGEKSNRNQIEGKHITGLQDEFLPGGCHSCEFMPLDWRTWRFLQVDVQTEDQPLQIEKLKAWFTAFPFNVRAHFDSDDESLKSIWDVGWRTALLDAHDTYMDTPYWERLQYVGDTRIQALISYAVAGEDRLARQAIEAFNNSRIPDGLTQSRYPSSLVQMIPTFSLLWVGMVHDFWMYRDDPDFVREQLSGTRTVLEWYLSRQRSDGLIGNIPWWPFVDWGKDFGFGMPPQDENGGSAVITLQFVEALRYAAEMEAELGDPIMTEKYRKAATRAASAVQKLCWNQQYGLLADTPAQTHFSQHANILGVSLGVIPLAQQKSVLTKILSTSDSGFTAPDNLPAMTAATYYFRFYLARALEHAGMGDQYLKLLGPWRQMLSLGLSTWAESPEPTRSESHAWSSHPNYDLLTIVAGIRPKGPGFKRVIIEPHLGTLNRVSAAMPIPKGIVEVAYTRAGNGYEAVITLSKGESGELIWKSRKFAVHEGSQTLALP
jgi:alpha-L-rhamnosidase